MKKILLFFAVATILAACNNDNEVLNETQYITEFKADFGGADTRMTATADNGLKFAWDDGDWLYVYNPEDESDYYEFYYDSSDDKFYLYLSSKSNEGLTVNKSYFATSQGLDNDSYTSVGGNFAVKTQLWHGDVSTIPLISDLFLAKADGTIATMHHTVGVVEVPVKLDAESTISKSVDVSIAVSDDNVVGSFYATPKSPYYAGIIGGGDFYDDSYAYQHATLNKSTFVSFFIPMLPGTYVNPKLWYHDEDGELAADPVGLTGTLTIERGKVTKMPEQVPTLNYITHL